MAKGNKKTANERNEQKQQERQKQIAEKRREALEKLKEYKENIEALKKENDIRLEKLNSKNNTSEELDVVMDNVQLDIDTINKYGRELRIIERGLEEFLPQPKEKKSVAGKRYVELAQTMSVVKDSLVQITQDLGREKYEVSKKRKQMEPSENQQDKETNSDSYDEALSGAISSVGQAMKSGADRISSTEPSRNYRKVSFNEENKERFEDLEALDAAIRTSADHAGIKKERPDLSLIADGAVSIGHFRNGEYVPTMLRDVEEPFSLNGIHVTPSMGLKPYIPQPKLTAGEQSALEKKYNVDGLRDQLRDIMIGYRTDEYNGIGRDMGGRNAMLRASERMIKAVNELTQSSSMFQAIHSADPEERVWAQKKMLEIFESASNEYEHRVNDIIDRLDPVLLAKKAKEREHYAKEMRSLGDQGIRQMSDPSNMFGSFVLMSFCPPLAIALLVPMLLPNLIAWMSQKGAESAMAASKDAESLRIQEKSGSMSAKIIGNIALARIVPALAAGVSPEEMGRLTDSIREDMKAFGSKTQTELAKILENVSKMTPDGRTIKPDTAAYVELVKCMNALGVEVSRQMLDITGNGEIGAAVDRMKAVREIAEASGEARFFEIDESAGRFMSRIQTRKAKEGEVLNPPLFSSPSMLVKGMSESLVKDADSYVSNLGLIQGAMILDNGNIMQYLAQADNENIGEKAKQKASETLEKMKDRKNKRKKTALVKENGAQTPQAKEKNFGELKKEGFAAQATQTDAVSGMLALRKLDGKGFNPDSEYHYTRYGFARDEKGVRVGKNVDVKLSTIFSAFKAMSDVVKEENRNEDMLVQRYKDGIKVMCKEIQHLNHEVVKTLLLITPEDRKLIQKDDSGVIDIKILKENLRKFNLNDNDIVCIKERIKLSGNEINKNEYLSVAEKEKALVNLASLQSAIDVLTEQRIELDEAIVSNEQQRINDCGREYLKTLETIQQLTQENMAYADRELESTQLEIRACNSRGNDLLGAFMADMSMRMVPQEAWGAVYSLDSKFLDMKKGTDRMRETVVQSLRGKFSGNSGTFKELNSTLNNVELAAEKLHEANKLSIAAFIISRQLKVEQDNRIASGEAEPSTAEKMAASVMSGMLSKAASLELEAAPVMAKAADMVYDYRETKKWGNGNSAVEGRAAEAVASIVTAHVNGTAAITGGKLLSERIADASEKLGHSIMDMEQTFAQDMSETSRDSFKSALQSGLLSGGIYIGEDPAATPWSDKIQEIVQVLDKPGWTPDSDEETRITGLIDSLSEFRREGDSVANRDLRKMLKMEDQDRGKWNDTISLMTSWYNETSMSGLISRLVGTHVDADVESAELGMSGKLPSWMGDSLNGRASGAGSGDTPGSGEKIQSEKPKDDSDSIDSLLPGFFEQIM